MTTLRCPSCGNTDLSGIRFLEWVPSTRPIERFDGAQLQIGSDYRDDYEGAKDDSLECRRCFATWPIPKEVAVEFRS